MSTNPRGPVLLRLVALFFGPLVSVGFLFIPRGDGVFPALVAYVLLLLGFGVFAAAAMTPAPGARVAAGVALAIGMFLLHLVVGVAGCTFAVAVS